MTRTNAILLDALGTLVALEPPAPRLQRVLAARFAVPVSVPEAERAIAAEIAYYRDHLNDGRDRETLAALRRRCAQTLRDALPAAARERLADTGSLVEALLESLEFSVFEDVRPALQSLRARGLMLVVVSNWDVSLAEVLARVDLAPLLEGIVTSAAVGQRKPATAIFQRGLQLAGVEPARALHVGDSMREDVEGARAAGVEPVLVRRDGAPGPPDVRTIATLAELEPLV